MEDKQFEPGRAEDKSQERQLEKIRQRQQELVEHAKEIAADDGPRRKLSPEEISEAKAIVADYLSAGEYPKITVDRKHLEEILENGLKARPTAYQKNVKLIVGTLGRDAFLPEEQDRVILEIHTDPKRVTPRFTGEARAFEGIVVFELDEIPPKDLRVIDPKAGDDGKSSMV